MALSHARWVDTLILGVSSIVPICDKQVWHQMIHFFTTMPCVILLLVRTSSKIHVNRNFIIWHRRVITHGGPILCLFVSECISRIGMPQVTISKHRPFMHVLPFRSCPTILGIDVRQQSLRNLETLEQHGYLISRRGNICSHHHKLWIVKSPLVVYNEVEVWSLSFLHDHITLSNCYQPFHFNNINDIASFEFIGLNLPVRCYAESINKVSTQNRIWLISGPPNVQTILWNFFGLP